MIPGVNATAYSQKAILASPIARGIAVISQKVATAAYNTLPTTAQKTLSASVYDPDFTFRPSISPSPQISSWAEVRAIQDSFKEQGRDSMVLDWSFLGYTRTMEDAAKSEIQERITQGESSEPFPIGLREPVYWASQIGKASLAFGWMLLPMDSLGLLGTPASFKFTLAYLSLSALGSATADLVSKWGFNLHRVVTHWNRICITKLTTALLVASLIFPFINHTLLYWQQNIGHSNAVWFGSLLLVSIIDGAYNSLTRRIRGYSDHVALRDAFRPFVGLGLLLSVGAILGAGSYVFGSSSECDTLFEYLKQSAPALIAMRIGKVAWSSGVEGIEKRREKTEVRVAEQSRMTANSIFPDPAAKLALDLANQLGNRSISHSVLEMTAQKTPGFMAQVAQCLPVMQDNDRIKSAINLLFPHEPRRAEIMFRDFSNNRAACQDWLTRHFGPRGELALAAVH